MADRAQLEQTLTERGVPFDHYATDDALELMVEQSDARQYDPAQQLADRSHLEAYLQARGIDYHENETDEYLRYLVLTQQDAEHARYLETYAPVITRLPGAVNTAPELPEPDPNESEAEPQSAAAGESGSSVPGPDVDTGAEQSA